MVIDFGVSYIGVLNIPVQVLPSHYHTWTSGNSSGILSENSH